MITPLRIPNAYRFSQTLPERPLVTYAYVFARENGNVIVEPLLPDERTVHALDELGGLSLIVVMSEERHEAARALAARYGPYADFAWTIYDFAMRHMRLPDGSFLFQRRRYWTNRAAHVRWGAAPMLLALTHLESDSEPSSS